MRMLRDNSRNGSRFNGRACLLVSARSTTQSITNAPDQYTGESRIAIVGAAGESVQTMFG